MSGDSSRPSSPKGGSDGSEPIMEEGDDVDNRKIKQRGEHSLFNAEAAPMFDDSSLLGFLDGLKMRELPVDQLSDALTVFIKNNPQNVRLSNGDPILHYIMGDSTARIDLLEAIMEVLVVTKSSSIIYEANLYGQSPLAVAVYSGNTDAAKVLLTKAKEFGVAKTLLMRQTRTASNIFHTAAG
jgi:hypothetical protein